ncbi:unnamed protein product [Caenorhabditis bovis]|uniref:FHA domain-containing protein n=1 Tax=Caenorhabditis bovis TaxID=2654633 RepID=A0A8S1F8I6_9PELO|nr:unnamed protein product [Caenorhabditis bovis]
MSEAPDERSKFEIPSWATKPPPGSHLDKLMIDEKKAYYFGRNNKQVDFAVEHASCSRVHCLLLYHGLLQRFAIVDMESSHGTFIGSVRLQPLEVVFIEVGKQFHLGASTRRYAVRLKVDEPVEDDPAAIASDQHLDHVTEYNTAQNRRIPNLPISLEEARRKKRPRGNVAFIEEEEIINPEDVDPSVGRFRNLITTAIISTNPAKRPGDRGRYEPPKKIVRPCREVLTAPLSSTFGPVSLNAAPDLELYGKTLPQPGNHYVSTEPEEEETSGHMKKKYAKEAWPGRKPGVF